MLIGVVGTTRVDAEIVRNVEASLSADARTVSYRALDPDTGEWEEGSQTTGGGAGDHDIYENLRVRDGIVCWETATVEVSTTPDEIYSGKVVHYCVYDQALGAWQCGAAGAAFTRTGSPNADYNRYQDLRVTDGIVYWQKATVEVNTDPHEVYAGKTVYCCVYDETLHAWKCRTADQAFTRTGSPNADYNRYQDLKVTDGIVYWQKATVEVNTDPHEVYKGKTVYCCIYDETLQAWQCEAADEAFTRTGSPISDYNRYQDVKVTDGIVYWQEATVEVNTDPHEVYKGKTVYYRTYDETLQAWKNGAAEAAFTRTGRPLSDYDRYQDLQVTDGVVHWQKATVDIHDDPHAVYEGKAVYYCVYDPALEAWQRRTHQAFSETGRQGSEYYVGLQVVDRLVYWEDNGGEAYRRIYCWPLHTWESPGVIWGHVYAGDPAATVSGHRVSIEEFDTGKLVADVLTDVNGGYGYYVSSGDYRLRTISAESANVYLLDEYYDDQGYYEDATRVTVNSPAAATNIDFHLALGGRFSGTVRCQSNGTAIAGAEIAVYDENWNHLLREVEQQGAFTHEDGAYSLCFPTGSYYVAASGRIKGEGLAYRDEYYDESTTRAGATQVVVTAGTTTGNVDFTLSDLPPVHVETDVEPFVVLPGEEVEIWSEVRDGAAPVTSVVAEIETPDETVVAALLMTSEGDSEFSASWTSPAPTEAHYFVDIIATDTNGNASTNSNVDDFYAHVPVTIHVDDSNAGPEDGSAAHPYNTISEGVSNASPSDTVLVHDGTYTELVNMGISQVTLRSENGYASTTVMRPASAPTSGVAVIAVHAVADVTVEGFTVSTGLANPDNAGIWIGSAWQCIAARNYVYGSGSGITFGEGEDGESEACTARGNVCVSNVWAGIHLEDAWGCLVAGNRCDHNAVRGIMLEDRNSHSLIGNSCVANGQAGIDLTNCTGNVVARNTCMSNAVAGIRVTESSGNSLFLNTLTGNATNVVSPVVSNTNLWRTQTPMHYVYTGGVFSSALGNYYADRTGNDTDGDGIGSQTYATDGADDASPLWQPSTGYRPGAWWLAGDGRLYCDAMDRGHGFVEGGTQNVWIAIEPFAVPSSYATAPWHGQLYLVEPPANGATVRVEVGSSPDGTTFVPGGPDAMHTQTGDTALVTFTTDSAAFAVPAGSRLAVRLTSSTPDYDMFVGGPWSYVSGPIPDPTDIDRDNLRDSWELRWAGDLSILGATGDYDADGLPDPKEANAGTDPTSAASVLATTGTSRDDTSRFVVHWDSVSGVVYRVYDTPGLDTSWSNTGYQVEGDGTRKSYTNNDLSTPGRFFRVGAEAKK